jgi:hypothetical protein
LRPESDAPEVSLKWCNLEDPDAKHSGTFDAVFTNGHNATLLSQDLATISGATYTLSFWLRHPVEETSFSNFSASFGGANVFTLTPQATFGYTGYSFNVGATSAVTTLEFSFLEGLWFFDDVSVEFLSGPPSVPETGSTLASLSLALVVIEGLRRKLALA